MRDAVGLVMRGRVVWVTWGEGVIESGQRAIKGAPCIGL